MTKKIALILTGLPRVYEKSMEFWEPLISKYNPDIFVHTWDVEHSYNHLTKFVQRFHPVCVKVDKPQTYNWEQYLPRTWQGINVYNLFSSWDSVKRGYQLMESHYQTLPDIVIRARMDIWSPYLEILDLPTLVIPMEPFKQPAVFHYKEQFLVTQQDVLCYGPPKEVKKYCSLIDNIHILMESDPSLLMVGEYIIAAHIWSQQLAYYSHLFPYTLVRE